MCLCYTNSRDSKSWKLSKLLSCKIYGCLRKRKKNRVPFPCQSQDQRKGRKHLAVKRQQTSLGAKKGSFFNQDEWLQEVEEHEWKLDTSGKQSDFAGILTDLDRIPRVSFIV